MKQCKKCSKILPLDQFPKNGKYYRTKCKLCHNEQHRKRGYVHDKEKRRAWLEKNREKIREYNRQKYLDNRDEVLERSRKYYENNKKHVKARTKKYRQDHPEWYRDYKRRWGQENKLIKNIRRGIWGCLCGSQKNSKSMSYVGCSVDELWIYLESLFEDGMTKDNYGEWHVDHIRPLASFDFNGEDVETQLHEAWHYTNLQPLWADNNLSKGQTWTSDVSNS